MINIGNMAGNTFLNLFLLGLVEGPGTYLVDSVTRVSDLSVSFGKNIIIKVAKCNILGYFEKDYFASPLLLWLLLIST